MQGPDTGRVEDDKGRSTGYRKLVLMAFIVSALIPIVVYAYPRLFPDRAVYGPVAAVDLSREFITDTCNAVAKYHDKLWMIEGTIEVMEPPVYTYLDGGVHRPDPPVDCNGVRLFHGGRSWSEPVRIDLDQSVADGYAVGDTIQVTCRIRLEGFGAMDHLVPQIYGRDCIVAESTVE